MSKKTFSTIKYYNATLVYDLKSALIKVPFSTKQKSGPDDARKGLDNHYCYLDTRFFNIGRRYSFVLRDARISGFFVSILIFMIFM